ncbi:pectinesterase precursor [Apiospora hydei]|uniref:Pectinesterase n=1 Tax=Apiospora hydei TaxID=1337664 RepID=A0ABR1UUZ3_9PEZI
MAVDRPPLFHLYNDPMNSNCRPRENHAQFTLFPKLPLELQFLVWELAASEPRIFRLKVRASRIVNTTPLHDLQSSLLSACRASRKAFLEAPGLVRSPDGVGGPDSEGRRAAVVWHPDRDLVVFDTISLSIANIQDDIAGSNDIRHLAFPFEPAQEILMDLCHPSHFHLREGWLPRRFPNLKTWQIYADWIDP